MNYSFNFNLEKGIETIVYLSEKLAEPDLYRILKIIYFANKEHLEKYGRFICGDSYIAMEHGPVSSEIYNLFNAVKGEKVWISNEAISQAKASFTVEDQYKIKDIRSPNLDIFSDSDLECLNYALEQYSSLSLDELEHLSHDEAWKTTNKNAVIDIEKIVATLNNQQELISHLQDQYPGEAEW
ncbi:MAG: SocA family protein [Symploca sp. SIO2G7]|nr:SocA family protein [Symploca sp. SIO2G7]